MISDKADIHPTAIIGDNVEIGPWTMVGADVEIGDGCKIGPHAVIKGPCRLGVNNEIFSFASIGDAPQDKTYNGEPTELVIGDNNVIREYCTINRGTVKGGGVTRLGSNNFLMAYSHVAHDCQVGDHTIFAAYAALAGHVTVEDYVAIGPYSAVHQNCRLGESAFITKATYITQDVMPYIIAAGNSPRTVGINTVGIKRRGFSSDTVNTLRKVYKTVFRQGLTKQEAIDALATLAADYPPVEKLMLALQQSTRGIVR